MLKLVIATSVLSAVLAAASAHAERVVAMAPLTAVGNEDTTDATKKLTAQLEAAISAQPDTRLISTAVVGEAIKKAKKPQLRACEFDAACLTEVGKLVGATVVIAGEVVGIGEAKVVYLGATDVVAGKELRSTTLTLGAATDAGGTSGAVVRLLQPERYRGTLHFTIDVKGATIYINGSKAPLPPTGEVTLPVGTQAVRVTHPEYHDFVRFIDVAYDKTTEVPVGMTQYPIIRRDLAGKPTNRDHISYVDPPVWRRWYVVAPVAVGLAIVSGIIVGYLAHDFPDGQCRKVGGDPC